MTVVATSTTHRYKNGKRLEPVIDSRHVDFEAIVTLDGESLPEAAMCSPHQAQLSARRMMGIVCSFWDNSQ
ncbi:hypothetical protein C448_04045 [Halococcus morrhuae DSM 1307]|uniref:Uncharacterized protein n=1 Tax=Halococcus morrhuae DSM 1307 TaxID=931277 RepID=M0MUK1_HALMO|nr:hypothetical protein C448_04045 [Halococcus morrhuae DSM 1307]